MKRLAIVAADAEIATTLAEACRIAPFLAGWQIDASSRLSADIPELGIILLDGAELPVLPPSGNWIVGCAHALPVLPEHARLLHAPFHVHALLAALESLITPQRDELIPIADGLWLDPRRRSVCNAVQECLVELTGKETELLVFLLESPQRRASRESLLKQVWAYQQATDTHTLETHFSRLRTKLKPFLGETHGIVATDEGYQFID